MRRTIVMTIAAAVTFTLTACGSDAAVGAPDATARTADPEVYADLVIDAFRVSNAAGDGLPSDADPTDWTAFVRVIEDLTPPDGEEMSHERMVAGFESYVDALEDKDDACIGDPGPSDPEWGDCYTAVSAVSDEWMAALDRAYEVPGLSPETLLG